MRYEFVMQHHPSPCTIKGYPHIPLFLVVVSPLSSSFYHILFMMFPSKNTQQPPNADHQNRKD